MKAEPKTKVIGFPPVAPPAPSICEVCNSPKQSGSVCHICCLRLVDLALSSTSEEFPKLLVEPLSEEDLEPHQTLLGYDHYEICQTPSGSAWELGRGAMGITYKALDTHLGCPVALKVINTRRLAGANGRERLLREARTAARLRHPNIASVFHLGMSQENCFYAMEYIDGETVEACVRRDGPVPYETALNIVIQCGRALRVAHDQRFIHRDIKPTNIMLVNSEHLSDTGPVVKVIDFGLVKAVVEGETIDLAYERYFAGTPHYASPEQLDANAVDARSDIYSLGVCLWYMLAGKPAPLTVDPDHGTRRLSLSPIAAGEFPRNVPASVIALLQSMICPEPALRPQTAEELIQKARACLAASYSGTKSDASERVGVTRQRWMGGIKDGSLRTVCIALLGIATIVGAIIRFSLMTKSSPEPKFGSAAASALVEARVLYAQGDVSLYKHTKVENQRAIDFYSKAISRCPGFADAHAALAIAYFQNVVRFGAPATQTDLAVASAERAIALDPKAPKGYAALGAIRALDGRQWDALTQLHHALELDPNYPPAMRDFSRLWSSVGQPQLGLPWAKAAAQIEPANTAGWSAAAEASVDLCADDQAEDYYQRCLEINPAWVNARCGLMHIHLLQGKFALAQQDYATVESIEPGLILPLTLKAQIALFSGDYAEAENTYRHLLALNRTGWVNYYSGISYLSALGFLRSQAGDSAESESLLDEASKLHLTESDGPQSIYDLAAIRAVQNREEDALSLLNQAIASGWMDYRATRLDPRFKSLRENPRFDRMLQELSEHVTCMRKEAEQRCLKPLAVADYPVQPPKK